MPRARISVTIPEDVLRVADTYASVEKRSRSWVVTEAVAAFTRPEAPEGGSVAEAPAVGPGGAWIATFDDQTEYTAWKALDPAAHVVDPFRPRLVELCAALGRREARYLVTGTAALFLLGASRQQAGLELLVHPSKKNFRAVLGGLRDVGASLAVNGLRKKLRKRAATVFGGEVRADLLTSAGSLGYKEAQTRASTVSVEGVEVPLTSIGDLVASGLS